VVQPFERRQRIIRVSAEALVALLRGGRLCGYNPPADARVVWVQGARDTGAVELVLECAEFYPLAEGETTPWVSTVHAGQVVPRRPDICCHCGCPMAAELNHAAWHHPDGRTAHARCHSAWCHGLPGTDTERHEAALREHLDTIVGIYGPKEDDRD
jgi:hypothetical protein